METTIKQLFFPTRNATQHYSKEKFRSRNFGEEFWELFLIGYYLRIPLSLFSLVSGAFFFHSLLREQLLPILSPVLGSALVLIIELLKYYLTPRALANLFKGKWLFGIPLLLMAMPFFLLSVYCTVSGTEKFLAHQKVGEKLVKEKYQYQKDSLVNHYDQKITQEETRLQTLRKEAKETQTLKWKSTLQSLAFREKIIQDLMKEKTETLGNLKVTLTSKNKVSQKHYQSIQKHMVTIDLGLESLLLLCLIFITLYQYRVSQENDSETLQKPSTVVTETQKEAREIISNQLEVAQLLKAGKSYKEIRNNCKVGNVTIAKVKEAVLVLGY